MALASHDVLQPLNAAKLYLSALREINLNTETAGIFEKIDDSVSASEAMISTLLDISRLEQGDMQPTFIEVSLRKVLLSLVDEFEMVAQRKGLALTSNIPDLWIRTDSTYLHRIIRNLLSNAIKYTNIGSVEVRAETSAEHQGKVLIQVCDTGVGIPEEEQGKIFSDFYRVQNSQADGVGLGLGVVSRLSETINAKISVTSESFKGSCFSVLVDGAAPQVEQNVGPEMHKSGLKQLKVLCIDDEVANLHAMETLLTKWQLDVDCAKNLEEALVASKRREPQILLVDYQLDGDQTGIDIILRLRQEFKRDIPAVLITANRSDGVVKEASDNDVFYLTKPVKPAKLRALLRSMK